MKKSKKNSKLLGPVITLMIITTIVVVMSAIFSLLQVDADLTAISGGTLQTTIITVNNILTKDGIKYIISNILVNLQSFEPIALLIISLTAIGIGEASGLFNIIFKSFKKLDPRLLTFFTLFLGIIGNVVGEYSYIFLLPLIAIIYEKAGRKPLLGVLTMFIGLTIGYSTGIIYNYEELSLGALTEAAAKLDVDKNFVFSPSSNIYFMIVSTFILSIVGVFIIHGMLDKKIPKTSLDNEEELIESKKALYYSNLAAGIILVAVIYMIIPGLPGSGILLGSGENYIERLLSYDSPFYQGFTFIILGLNMICGFIYGFISKNFKNSTEYSVGLSKNFEGLGYLFVLLFFMSQLIGILEWTNLGKVIACRLIMIFTSLPFNGVMLVIAFFIFVILMTILIPSTSAKWELTSPLVVPFMMRSNIAPSFTQMIFRVADGVGKAITPFFAYYMVMLAFLEKYNNKENVKITVFGTLKMIMPTILVFAGLWLLIVVCWYIIGLPTGINIYPIL